MTESFSIELPPRTHWLAIVCLVASYQPSPGRASPSCSSTALRYGPGVPLSISCKLHLRPGASVTWNLRQLASGRFEPFSFSYDRASFSDAREGPCGFVGRAQRFGLTRGSRTALPHR